MRRLSRALRLPPSERNLLIIAFVVLVLIRIGLTVAPFRHVLHLVVIASTACRGRGRLEEAQIDRIPLAVSLAAWCVPRATCLVQALAAQALLTWQGRRVRLRLGLARDNTGKVSAHAWVESAGAVLIGGPHVDKYQPLWCLDGLDR